MLALLLALTTSQAASAPAAASPAPAAPADPLAPYLRDTPRCDPARPHCFGIHLHLVQTADGPVQSVDWITEQVAQAQRHFALIDTGLEIVTVDSLPAAELEIDDRAERDALGHDRFSRGVIHVFVVGRLADVDIAGNDIQGVHWRERADRSRRWVILSSIAGHLVLSHELGHFFGLPHSTYDISLMNKALRYIDPRDLTFAEPEVKRMRKHRDRMLTSKMLLQRATPAAK